MKLLIAYWLITTIYGTYWLIKHPSDRRYEDEQYFTLLELFGKFVFASIIAWMFVPMMGFASIKFKR